MAANSLSIEQIATILNAVQSQATGQAQLANINTSDFVTVATTTLQTGYDTVLNAISQVLSRTIFSVRPYERKFAGLEVDNIKWGNHVRKLSPVDGEAFENEAYKLVDGQSIDPFIVRKPGVLQTNFYGQDTYSKTITIFDTQLDQAFEGPENFGNFVSMIMSNVSDQLEQYREDLERGALANMITGKVAGDSANVLHLVTEYNAVAGTSLTAQTVLEPQNFVPFMKWAVSSIKTLALMMSNRSARYHKNVAGKAVMRHTPASRMKMYLSAAYENLIDASVMSSVYNDEYLKLADHESVAYWQAINSPLSVIATPTYMKADGTLETANAAQTVNGIFGLVFDEEAIGVTFSDQATTQDRNGRGRYTNMHWFETARYWNDFTENAVLLQLD